MKKKNLLITLNLIAAAFIVAATMVIVFKFWKLHEYTIFPVAYSLIIVGMFAFSGLILFRNSIYKKFGSGVYFSATVVSFIYYITIMISTWLLKDLWDNLYLGVAVLLFIFYLSLTTGLFRQAFGKHNDILRQENEKVKNAEIINLINKLEEKMPYLKNLLTQKDFESIESTFYTMKERQQMSTPFGRIEKIEVVAAEKSINEKLESAIKKVNQTAIETVNKKELSTELINSFNEVYKLIRTREKLIIQ